MNTVADLYCWQPVTEIGGCFAFWTWLRLGRSPLWGIVGTLSLVIFGVLLTRSEVAFAGRAYAAYGGCTSRLLCYGSSWWNGSFPIGGILLVREFVLWVRL